MMKTIIGAVLRACWLLLASVTEPFETAFGSALGRILQRRLVVFYSGAWSAGGVLWFGAWFGGVLWFGACGCGAAGPVVRSSSGTR